MSSNGTLVAPSRTAPASRSRRTAVALAGALEPASGGHPPRARPALDAEALLDVDRHAVQRAGRRSARNRLIRARGGRQRLVTQLVDVGVEGGLKRIDPTEGVLGQLDG